MTFKDSPANNSATREEMSEARLPLAYRDSCAGLLIPLNRCRVKEYYLPWKCEVSLEEDIKVRDQKCDILNFFTQNERHSYEKCQYDEFLQRVAKMDELRAANGGQRSN
ncbi:hypothetical protein EPUL_004275 [Erysiphe pulchra]|uniref:NADH dehydrogenase [ubiquinone] 1 beta subcomplex subunit 7 n=1 Tax=Erysiphe pulchra TaxID=225359 RepID=A0A2S4PNF7_9PEZI|nr:hypothetical protein EPUL_004275 [Erysiphe pulchra]